LAAWGPLAQGEAAAVWGRSLAHSFLPPLHPTLPLSCAGAADWNFCLLAYFALRLRKQAVWLTVARSSFEMALEVWELGASREALNYCQGEHSN
jgi:hypothetical protein